MFNRIKLYSLRILIPKTSKGNNNIFGTLKSVRDRNDQGIDCLNTAVFLWNWRMRAGYFQKLKLVTLKSQGRCNTMRNLKNNIKIYFIFNVQN